MRLITIANERQGNVSVLRRNCGGVARAMHNGALTVNSRRDYARGLVLDPSSLRRDAAPALAHALLQRGGDRASTLVK